MSGKDLTSGTGSGEVAAFLDAVRKAPKPSTGGERGRLVFALDATASRQPTWDVASHVQSEMFLEADRIGGLDVQLVFYRGFGECRASAWVSSPADLVRLMGKVSCLAGKTQIHRVLTHTLNETKKKRVQALIFVGDALEESIDELGEVAGQLGLQGVRVFLFHEGRDRTARMGFEQIAKLTKGACVRFDARAPDELRQLLRAVAAYAAGGMTALADLRKRSGGAVALLEQQLR